MNSTSFTSIESACTGNSDKMANIDSSSTAHLTLNVAGGSSTKSARWSNSDSDPERSPSVTVLPAIGCLNHQNHLNTDGNEHGDTRHLHHHQNPLARSSQLISSGFSLSNRLHLTKKQRNLWSRATAFEKILMLAVVILGTTNILLFISLLSVYTQQKHLLANQTLPDESHEPKAKQGAVNVDGLVNFNATGKLCLRPDCVKVAASVIEAIDLTVDPCDDFYVSLHETWLT